MKGMTIHVARAAGGDFTNGGISAAHDQLILVGAYDRQTRGYTRMPADSRLHEPTDERPAVLIETRTIGGSLVNSLLSVVPAVQAAENMWVPKGATMAGGNFASWSDSRVSEFVRHVHGSRFYGAIAIHDRSEW